MASESMLNGGGLDRDCTVPRAGTSSDTIGLDGANASTSMNGTPRAFPALGARGGFGASD